MAVKNRPVRPSKARTDPFIKDDNKKYLTDPVFLIGNGKSRVDFDLERLRSIGTIVGCNALFRDFSPDILLAIDAKMLREVKESGYAKENFCIVPGNRSVAIPGAYNWRTDRFNTTGCFAMKVISQLMKPSKCYMLGMDNYPKNMYDGTRNYAPNTLQNFSGVGNYYLKALQGPGDTVYINVNEIDAWPAACKDTGKYKSIDYETFEVIINAKEST